jgi:predicted RNase H-like nuclease
VFVLRDLQYRGTYSLREKTFRFQENIKFLARYFCFCKSFRENNTHFRENWLFSFSRKFSRKIYEIFAKIFAKIGFFRFARNFSRKIYEIFAKICFFRFRENFCEKYMKFSRKFSRKSVAKFRENLTIFA